jgi:hypothetical protein
MLPGDWKGKTVARIVFIGETGKIRLAQDPLVE